jgi:hypothetical protein
MKIGIIGAGNIGGSLGKRWTTLGHEIVFGVRDASSPKTQKSLEAAAFGEIIVIALPWAAVREVLPALGDLRGKILIDATNRFSTEAGDSPSAAEDIAKLALGAHVVKCFNTMGWETLLNPVFGSERASAFLCGDDSTAKATVAALAEALGLRVVDVGPLAHARHVESIAYLWVSMMRSGMGREMAFTLLRR